MGVAGYQVNALLPKGIGAGTAKVEVLFRKAPASAPGQIEVTSTPELRPVIVAVADGLDLASRSVRSGAMKVTMDNVAEPKAVRFQVDAQPVSALEFVCVDPLASSYEFAFLLPALCAGSHTLTAQAPETDLPPIEIEIEKMAE
jgi:hypothetical protein